MDSPKLSEKDLAAELEKWIKSQNTKYKNFWYHNAIGILIRKTLIECGRWKTKTGPNKGAKVKATEELSPKILEQKKVITTVKESLEEIPISQNNNSLPETGSKKIKQLSGSQALLKKLIQDWEDESSPI